MKRIFVLLSIILLAFILTGCAGIGRRSSGSRGTIHQEQPDRPENTARISENGNFGQRVLRAGEKLAFYQKKIIKGSCWDFINAVFNEAGFPDGKRKVVFQGPSKGPYADPEMLRPGDWVMHINLEYNGVEHSSLFVSWIDRGRRLAKVMDYVGMNKAQPGDYSQHTYTKIFGIVRAGE